jgi:hypothetical protein
VFPKGIDVPVETLIRITFSEPMLKEETRNAFSITPIIQGTFYWEKYTMIFTPNTNLALDTTYNVSISIGAKDLVGNSLQTQFSWDFKTTSVSDTIPPTIVDAFPTGVNVPVNVNISITFSEFMDEQATEQAFSILPSVNGTFKWVGRTLTFTPSSNLAYDTQYFVIISNDAKDVVGNSLRDGYQLNFYTGKEPSGSKGDEDDLWDILEPIITGLTIMASALAFMFGFYSIRKKRRRLRKYLDKIDETYETHKNNFDECESELKKLRDTIKSEVKDGKIEENHFLILNSRIREHIKDIRAAKKEADVETGETESKLKTSKCPKCQERFEIPHSDEPKLKIQCPECGAKGSIKNPYLKEIKKKNIKKQLKQAKIIKSETEELESNKEDDVEWK